MHVRQIIKLRIKLRSRQIARSTNCEEFVREGDLPLRSGTTSSSVLMTKGMFSLQNFLRNLPDCLFECDLYEEWCDAVENIEDKAADKIKK